MRGFARASRTPMRGRTAACGVALDARVSLGDQQVQVLRQLHANDLAVVKHQAADGPLFQVLGPVIILGVTTGASSKNSSRKQHDIG